MNTIFSLMAEYNTGEIPLRNICLKYLGMEFKTAAYHASKSRLPFPVYKGGKQKSEWLVSVDVLAKYLDDRKSEAQGEWEKVNAA